MFRLPTDLESCAEEHGVDELVDALVRQLLRLGDDDERVEQLGQLRLVDLAVLVVVAHVEDDAEFVVGAALGEQHDRVEELLKDDDSIESSSKEEGAFIVHINEGRIVIARLNKNTPGS